MDVVPIPKAVVQKAEEWRSTRSGSAPSWLYYNFIERFPEGQLSSSQMLELLGEPTQHSGSSYCFEAIDGGTLYLEATVDRQLGGWKMD